MSTLSATRGPLFRVTALCGILWVHFDTNMLCTLSGSMASCFHFYPSSSAFYLKKTELLPPDSPKTNTSPFVGTFYPSTIPFRLEPKLKLWKDHLLWEAMKHYPKTDQISSASMNSINFSSTTVSTPLFPFQERKCVFNVVWSLSLFMNWAQFELNMWRHRPVHNAYNLKQYLEWPPTRMPLWMRSGYFSCVLILFMWAWTAVGLVQDAVHMSSTLISRYVMLAETTDTVHYSRLHTLNI